MQEFTDKRAAEKIDIGLEGDREPSPDDRILQCCLHYQVRSMQCVASQVPFMSGRL